MRTSKDKIPWNIGVVTSEMPTGNRIQASATWLSWCSAYRIRPLYRSSFRRVVQVQLFPIQSGPSISEERNFRCATFRYVSRSPRT